MSSQSDFIGLSEAAALAGIPKTTLKHKVFALRDDPSHEDRHHIQPDQTEYERLRKTNTTFQWKISHEFLDRIKNQRKQKSQVGESPKNEVTTDRGVSNFGESPLGLLREQLNNRQQEKDDERKFYREQLKEDRAEFERQRQEIRTEVQSYRQEVRELNSEVRRLSIENKELKILTEGVYHGARQVGQGIVDGRSTRSEEGADRRMPAKENRFNQFAAWMKKSRSIPGLG